MTNALMLLGREMQSPELAGRYLFVITFQVLDVQPNDRQHRAGHALPALARIGNDVWFRRDDGKSDLCARSSEEQPRALFELETNCW